jgi:hypothetical protein
MRHTRILPFLAAILLGLFLGCSRYDAELLGEPEPEPAPQEEQMVPYETPPGDFERATEPYDVGMFDDLKFYGTWHWVEPYGWVWRPIVVAEWQPFLYGHWIWSEYGWMWVSYDPWGWATSHYGFWVVDFIYGWIWIPDYTWSPCRCDWIMFDDYIGWAPMPPPGVRYRDPWEAYEDNPWITVPAGKFKSTNIGNFRTVPKYKTGYTDRSIVRSAPEAHDIERITHKPVSRVDVDLDRRVVGEREFARVKLPADQQSIVNKQRSKMKTIPPSSGRPSSSAEKIRSGGSTQAPGGAMTPPSVAPAPQTSDDPRTKDKSKTEPKKDSGGSKEKPQDFKEKRKEEKKEEPKEKKKG